MGLPRLEQRTRAEARRQGPRPDDTGASLEKVSSRNKFFSRHEIDPPFFIFKVDLWTAPCGGSLWPCITPFLRKGRAAPAQPSSYPPSLAESPDCTRIRRFTAPASPTGPCAGFSGVRQSSNRRFASFFPTRRCRRNSIPHFCVPDAAAQAQTVPQQEASPEKQHFLCRKRQNYRMIPNILRMRIIFIYIEPLREAWRQQMEQNVPKWLSNGDILHPSLRDSAWPGAGRLGWAFLPFGPAER